MGSTAADPTYYDILEIKQDADLNDIRKAYRRLALKHHPDRNLGNEEESTQKFRQINHAYEILSDARSRSDYDRSLRFGAQEGHRPGWSAGGDEWYTMRTRREWRDPFAQFDDLFRNDPFFKNAFKEMDDLFARTFFEDSTTGGRRQTPQRQKKGWLGWVADKLGVNVQVNTRVRHMDGSTSASSYSGGRRPSNSRSTYTSRSTRTVIKDGKRITIQSLEKDGNRIEEHYVNNNLVERLINGVPEDIGLIDKGDL